MLSAQAARLLVKFEEEVEEMLRSSGDLADVPAWGGKLVGLVARLAGLLISPNTPAPGSTQTRALFVKHPATSAARYEDGHRA